MTPHVYGVFLRPDATTAVAISNVTFHVARQFGFVSAGAFPPHATLAGSVPLLAEPDEVVALLDPALRDRAGFPVHNLGIVKHATAITYEVDRMPDGRKNDELRELAVDVNAVLQPHAVPLDAHLVGEFAPDRFRAHLSLASHELQARPDLSDEVEEFIRALPFEPSPRFEARDVALYRFFSADWSRRWWEDLTWEHVRTWRLASAAPGAVVGGVPGRARSGAPTSP